MRTSVNRRPIAAALFATMIASVLAACSSTSPSATAPAASSGMPGMSMTGASPSPSPSASAAGMSGMGMSGSDPMYSGTGLSPSDGGFTLAPVDIVTLSAGTPLTLHFKIIDARGTAITAFEPDQTKLMHFYLIRSDLTGFQHVHPTMAADGTWSANLAALTPSSYRAYVAFNAKNASGTVVAEVLSQALVVPGAAHAVTLPPAASTTSVDGYTLTASGEMMHAMTHTLTIAVSKNGAPVTDLEPYLQTYAHLTAIHAGDLAFAHLHPESAAAMSDTGGPTLTFQTSMPESGDWRFFIQFQTGGVLHTAAITLHVG